MDDAVKQWMDTKNKEFENYKLEIAQKLAEKDMKDETI